MDNGRITDLIYKFHSRTLTDVEKQEFESLLETSASARQIFHQWNFVNQASEAVTVQNNLSQLPVNPRHLHNRKTVISTLIIQVAAILTLPLLLLTGYLLFRHPTDEPITYNEIVCSDGKVITLMLSDSSVVHLYSHSKLRYPSVFNENERLVQLNGEATFEVRANKERPFYVQAANMTKVKAYGTKFNVSSYESDSVMSVYLEHGAVNLESPLLKHAIVLKPNYRVDYNYSSNQYNLVKDSFEKYQAREHGVLLFKKTPLKDIASKLSKIYGINIVMGDAAAAEHPFTGHFKDENIYQVIGMLKRSSPELSWRLDEDNAQIIVTSKR